MLDPMPASGGSGAIVGYVAKTTNFSVLSTYRGYVIDVDTSAGNVTVTQIAAVTAGSGFSYIIRKSTSDANTVILGTVDGGAKTLTKVNEGRLIISTGAAYISETWQDPAAVAITAGTITGITDLAVADGGTGASTAAGARTNLGSTTVGDALFIAATAAAARSTLGVDTGDSPQFAGVNVGAATDTTITRTGAGDIAVEGNALYRAGGTDVPVTDGGTGASTAAAAATNLGLGTASNPQFATIELGAATDTTISRTGAGEIAVEGNRIFRVGGADVPVADGGTGLSTFAQGDILYASAANTIAALAKDTNSTRSLTNTGSSNSPAWAQVALATGVSGTLPVGNGGTGAANAQFVYVDRTTSQGSFTDSAYVKVQHSNEVFDANGIFDNATNYRCTPTLAGKYLVVAAFQFATLTATAYGRSAIYKNGTLFAEAQGLCNTTASTGVTATTIIDMNGTTDYIEHFATQNSGGTASSTSSTVDNRVFLAIVRLTT